jgi:pteridine reductase
MDLAGKVALVTGGGRRLGKAIALALARAGAAVVVHYGSSTAAAEGVAEEIRGLGVAAWTVGADLADPGAIDGLFARVAAEAGRLDVLVNSAATFERRPFDEITVADWERVLAVNLRAPFLCLQRAARLMRSSPRADEAPALVVNLVDLSGTLAWRGQAHHAVSKAGLAHLTRVAARELAPAVRVNAVQPGAILPPPGVAADSPAWRETWERLPLARPGRPELVGDAVVFLAGNDFITGSILPVEGGESLLGAAHH